MQKTQVWSLGGEDALEKGMAAHSSIFAWRIPWTRILQGYTPWGHTKSQIGLNNKHFALLIPSWGLLMSSSNPNYLPRLHLQTPSFGEVKASAGMDVGEDTLQSIPTDEGWTRARIPQNRFPWCCTNMKLQVQDEGICTVTHPCLVSGRRALERTRGASGLSW